MTDQEIRAKALEIAAQMISPMGKFSPCLILERLAPAHLAVAKAVELYLRYGNDMRDMPLPPDCPGVSGECNGPSRGCTHTHQS